MAGVADRYNRFRATGTGAVSVVTTEGNPFRIVSVKMTSDTAPSTSENLIVRVDADESSVYDTVLFTKDPSVEGNTNIVWIPQSEAIQPDVFLAGDHISASYTNTDGNTVAITVTLERVE